MVGELLALATLAPQGLRVQLGLGMELLEVMATIIVPMPVPIPQTSPIKQILASTVTWMGEEVLVQVTVVVQPVLLAVATAQVVVMTVVAVPTLAHTTLIWRTRRIQELTQILMVVDKPHIITAPPQAPVTIMAPTQVLTQIPVLELIPGLIPLQESLVEQDLLTTQITFTEVQH